MLERLENPISFTAGAILAVLYWGARFQMGTIVVYSWIAPFFIGCAIPKFVFAVMETKIRRTLREIDHPSLPEARVVETSRVPPAPAAIPIPMAPLVAPMQPEPLAPGEGPRLLK